ncbi:DNA replication protein [uncultured Gammaproteobacteria bacterium]
MTAPEQLVLNLGHRPALARKDFVVSPANTEALAWIERWPRWLGWGSGSGLVLHGPSGCGKSHLLSIWRERVGVGTVLATGAALTPDSVPELAAGGAVAVDDAAAVAGDGARERALFHLHNLLAERGGALLLAAVEPPARWPGLILPDLRSRLLALPVAAIGAPDDALLAALLAKLFSDRQLHPTAEVIAWLVARMERSCVAAGRLVAELDRRSLAERRPITIRLAQAVMVDTAFGDQGVTLDPP